MRLKCARLYITPREEEGVKVVFQSACCSNFTRAREKGIELQKRARDRREKKKIFQKGAKVFRVYLLP